MGPVPLLLLLKADPQPSRSHTMPISAAYIRHRRPVDYGVTPGTTTISRRGAPLLRRFVGVAQSGLSGGAGDCEFTLVYGDGTEPAFAAGALLFSTATGTVGGIINGVTLTATAAGGDILSAALVSAVINASSNALVQGFVTSNNLGATLTLTSVAAGNTVDICGTTFTARSGTSGNLNVSGAGQGFFDMSGTDTADALSLATAINQMPGVSRFVSAISVAGVVHLMARRYNFTSPTFSWPTGPGVPSNTIISNAATIVASGASLVASAKVNLNACVPGVQGNAVTAALSGTGVTVLGTQARLIGGLGLNAISITDLAY